MNREIMMGDQIKIDALSCGGGVDSTAMIVLMRQGIISRAPIIWSNVGDDSEHPASLAYVRDILRPYCAHHHLEFVECQKHYEDGTEATVYTHTLTRGNAIPVYLSKGKPANRHCTADFKVVPVTQELRKRGYGISNPARVAIGFALEETKRMKPSETPWVELVYPLIRLHLDRSNCLSIIAEEGLPPPPKSSCWFCPFQSARRWEELRADYPDLFTRAVLMEQVMQAQFLMAGYGIMHLHRFRHNLEEVVTGLQRPLFVSDEEEQSCGPWACKAT